MKALNVLRIENNKLEFVDILSELKGSGSFATKGTVKFKQPGLIVKGFGEIAYPINEFQVNGLLAIAKKAPFGKGHSTVYDDKVRRVWEIDANNLSFTGESWTKQLRTILEEVKENLGISGYKVNASLYKLLIYRKGDFFLPHRDSEKEKGMFGSLIIG